jgi:hypothetical protein
MKNIKIVLSSICALGAYVLLAGCASSPDGSVDGQPTARTTEGLSSGPIATPGSSPLLPAYAVAWPGADCTLRPEGNSDKNESLDLLADDDGIVQFYAYRLSSENPAAEQSLECTDEQGHSGTYRVDLSSATPFDEIHVPADPSKWRPALAGSPSDYSISELIEMGYGLRPDPNTNASAYAGWLSAAIKPARPTTYSHRSRPLRNSQTGSISDGNWTGPIITPNFYQETVAWMQVPEVIPGGDAIKPKDQLSPRR